MLPLGTVLTAVAPGQWMVARTPDAKAAVIAAFQDAPSSDDVWAQLEVWSTALHAVNLPGLAVPVPLRLPDAVPRIAYESIPWRVGANGLPAVPTPPQVLQVLHALAGTLDALHAANIVHGALGLASLWWQSAEEVLLPDVGLAHVLDGLVQIPTTAAAYHAPEIWRGASPAAASDQYALAIIALELFTGKARTAVTEVEGIVAFEPVVIDSHNPIFRGASRGMFDVFQRALAAAPSARFASCTEFVEALEGHVVPLDSLRTFHQPLHRIRQGITLRGTAFTAAAVAAIATAIIISRTPSSAARIAESVKGKLPEMGGVQTIMPAQATSPTSMGDAFGSRQRTSRIDEREQVGGNGPERLTVDPDPSSIRTTGTSAEQQSSSEGAQGEVVPPRTVNTSTTVSGGGVPDVSRAPTTGAISTSTQDSAGVAGSVGEVISGAVSSVVRAVTGASAPITGQRAVASAELARGGTIRIDVPSGSRVYLDGVLLSGTTTYVTATPGPHDVDVLLPGTTVPQRRRITVVASDTTIVQLRTR